MNVAQSGPDAENQTISITLEIKKSLVSTRYILEQNLLDESCSYIFNIYEWVCP